MRVRREDTDLRAVQLEERRGVLMEKEALELQKQHQKASTVSTIGGLDEKRWQDWTKGKK